MRKEITINNIKVLKFELKLETGLHIGGNKENYGIGGIDSPVIKNPITNEPIIPGSSLKGKIRMLMEIVENQDYKYSENKISIERMFGYKKDENKEECSLTRVIFRDLTLTEESKKELEEKLGEGFYTEIKAENTIDKIKSKAMPRFLERVPAGAIFSGECIINFQKEDCEDYEILLKQGFSLLENNYLGGNGSRGYGKVTVKFID